MSSVKLLIVEDQALILMALTDTLTEAGYEVIIAESAAKAMQVLEADASSLHGLITDIRLPGKVNGWDIAKRARELVSDMPIVYVSGDSAIEWSANGVPGSLMLSKPYAASQLVTAIAQLLNARLSNP